MDNKTLVTAGAIAIAISGKAVTDYLRTRRIERAKREQIELNLQRDLAAIRVAHDMVQENIRNGVYREYVGFGITEITNDFEFYKMTAHFED